MDHTPKPAEAPGLPMPGPPWHGGSPEEQPSPFIPLRLINPHGGMLVRLTRPEMLVGRHSEVDVRLPLPDVSRRHCRFVYADGTWQVFDLKSLNGVYVNGERVERAVLHQGDVIGIGGFAFEVDLAEEAPPAEASASGPPTTDGIWQSIADALPRPTPEPGYEQRRAS